MKRVALGTSLINFVLSIVLWGELRFRNATTIINAQKQVYLKQLLFVFLLSVLLSLVCATTIQYITETFTIISVFTLEPLTVQHTTYFMYAIMSGISNPESYVKGTYEYYFKLHTKRIQRMTRLPEQLGIVEWFETVQGDSVYFVFVRIVGKPLLLRYIYFVQLVSIKPENRTIREHLVDQMLGFLYQTFFCPAPLRGAFPLKCAKAEMIHVMLFLFLGVTFHKSFEVEVKIHDEIYPG